MAFITVGIDTSRVYNRKQPPGGQCADLFGSHQDLTTTGGGDEKNRRFSRMSSNVELGSEKVVVEHPRTKKRSQPSVCPVTGETIGHNGTPPEAGNKTEARDEMIKKEKSLVSKKQSANETTNEDVKADNNTVVIPKSPTVDVSSKEKQSAASTSSSAAEVADTTNAKPSQEKTLTPSNIQTTAITEYLSPATEVLPAPVPATATPAPVSATANLAPVSSTAVAPVSADTTSTPIPAVAYVSATPVPVSANSAPIQASATPAPVSTSANPGPLIPSTNPVITSGSQTPVKPITAQIAAKVEAAPIPVKSRRIPPGGHTTAFW